MISPIFGWLYFLPFAWHLWKEEKRGSVVCYGYPLEREERRVGIINKCFYFYAFFL